jgi:hypothetical protein
MAGKIHIVCVDCRKERGFPKKHWVFDTKKMYDPIIERERDLPTNERWERTDTEFIEEHLFRKGWTKGIGGYVCNTCSILRAQRKKP